MRILYRKHLEAHTHSHINCTEQYRKTIRSLQIGGGGLSGPLLARLGQNWPWDCCADPLQKDSRHRPRARLSLTAPNMLLTETPSGSHPLSLHLSTPSLFFLALCVSICTCEWLSLFLKPKTWLNAISIEYSLMSLDQTCFQLHSSPPPSFSPQDFLPHNI